jgi:hypothetical protein
MLFSAKCNDFRGLVFQSARSRRIDGETSKHSDLDEIEKAGKRYEEMDCTCSFIGAALSCWLRTATGGSL